MRHPQAVGLQHRQLLGRLRQWLRSPALVRGGVLKELFAGELLETRSSAASPPSCDDGIMAGDDSTELKMKFQGSDARCTKTPHLQTGPQRQSAILTRSLSRSSLTRKYFSKAEGGGIDTEGRFESDSSDDEPSCYLERALSRALPGVKWLQQQLRAGNDGHFAVPRAGARASLKGAHVRRVLLSRAGSERSLSGKALAMPR
ncbi:hypothetical protein GA0061099_104116 [Bradyrhizobium yuanmingense]|uniref:Uncharacterized protein n=1 Tax=Bradyrhizobium yuanmingense TaxID=108015 RepID=A0A1C3XLB6_9BRAD|nr:hypothetical protein IQ15_07522 [Bradyrhizobium yuanmingense]SCB52846.1 hypothetical protein GA0061099_104116 [Bradyrhizobium yuanmingense]